ncbi:MAG TPA: hypothetical protein PK677_11380 [Acidiphilium sp.]|nr:hypothetical protein [Acidiphilium sp.]
MSDRSEVFTAEYVRELRAESRRHRIERDHARKFVAAMTELVERYRQDAEPTEHSAKPNA